MLTMNLPARRNQLTAFGIAAALVLGGAPRAHAQTVTLVDPNKLPDLAVSVQAPSENWPGNLQYVEIKVTNHPPLAGVFYKIPPVTDVAVNIDLTHFELVFVQPNSNLNCNSTPWVINEWSAVRCSGPLAYGATATIYAYVYPTIYCGIGYADAEVSTSALERSPANNRAIARTRFTACIN